MSEIGLGKGVGGEVVLGIGLGFGNRGWGWGESAIYSGTFYNKLLQGTLRKAASWSENKENVQTFLYAGFVWPVYLFAGFVWPVYRYFYLQALCSQSISLSICMLCVASLSVFLFAGFV